MRQKTVIQYTQISIIIINNYYDYIRMINVSYTNYSFIKESLLLLEQGLFYFIRERYGQIYEINYVFLFKYTRKPDTKSCRRNWYFSQRMKLNRWKLLQESIRLHNSQRLKRHNTVLPSESRRDSAFLERRSFLLRERSSYISARFLSSVDIFSTKFYCTKQPHI